MSQGVIKTYNPITGVGIVVREPDNQEVLLRPGSLSGSIFRNLRQGQRVVFTEVKEDDQLFATKMMLGQDGR